MAVQNEGSVSSEKVGSIYAEFTIKQGLIKKYSLETSNINVLKGKILFSKNITKNLVHKERFYTEHQVYNKDHTLHQILNSALKIVEYFTKGTHIFDQCKRVQLDFPEVSEIKITKKLLDNFEISRKSKSYSKVFEIARLILLNYSPDISTGNEKMLALLFDMNKLWEEYILVKLREELTDPRYEIGAQERKDFWGYNSLQPDIVINDKLKKEILIVDTKWKQPGNSSASIQDLRQMYSYNRFWNASKAVLLYPGEGGGNKFKVFCNKKDPIQHYCKMAFVNVLDHNGKLSELIGKDILEELEIHSSNLHLKENSD